MLSVVKKVDCWAIEKGRKLARKKEPPMADYLASMMASQKVVLTA